MLVFCKNQNNVSELLFLFFKMSAHCGVGCLLIRSTLTQSTERQCLILIRFLEGA